MNPEKEAEESEKRFAAYVAQLASVMGQADRARPLGDYCTGLLMPLERKSVEPLAALTQPGHASAQHQSLLHFVGEAAWRDEAVLAKVCELVLPSMARREPSRSLDYRRYVDTEQREALGRGRASILRPIGQAGQLPSSRIALACQSSCQSSGCLAALSAAGMDQSARALQESWCATRAPFQDQTADGLGTDSGGIPWRSATRHHVDGCRLRQRYPSAHQVDGTRADLCCWHSAANQAVGAGAAQTACG
jgi:hypothetical protein